MGRSRPRQCRLAPRGSRSQPLRPRPDQPGRGLSTRSEEFRSWWAAHDVKLHRTATKRLQHTVVGELELTGEALELPGDPGLTIIAYTVEPASPSEQALAFLASWISETRLSPTTDPAAK